MANDLLIKGRNKIRDITDTNNKTIYLETTPEFDNDFTNLSNKVDSIETSVNNIGGNIINEIAFTNWTGISSNMAKMGATAWSPELKLFATAGLSSSSDGLNWTQRAGTQCTDIVWSSKFGMFVALEKYGTIMSSSDGINWNPRVNPEGTAHIDGLKYNLHEDKNGNVSFYSIASNTSIIKKVTTTNGIDFTSTTCSGLLNSSFYGVGYSNKTGTYILAGTENSSSTSVTYYFFRSSDGITWTPITNITSSLTLKTFIGPSYNPKGDFWIAFAGQSTYTSPRNYHNYTILISKDDGISWNQVMPEIASSSQGYDGPLYSGGFLYIDGFNYSWASVQNTWTTTTGSGTSSRDTWLTLYFSEDGVVWKKTNAIDIPSRHGSSQVDKPNNPLAYSPDLGIVAGMGYYSRVSNN